MTDYPTTNTGDVMLLDCTEDCGICWDPETHGWECPECGERGEKGKLRVKDMVGL